MREEAFAHAVNEIAAFLGSKEVPPHTKSAWFDKVQNIPDEALPYIIAKITDDVDSMPRNLPKVFKEKFRAWQMENPNKCAAVVQQGCQDCELGILFLERTDERGGVHTGTIFCQCYSGNAGYVGRSTLAYMERQGWRSTKADKLGPEYGDKAAIKAQMVQAIQADANPDYQRKDLYGDAYEQEASWA